MLIEIVGIIAIVIIVKHVVMKYGDGTSNKTDKTE